jgi:hypothetical protein
MVVALRSPADDNAELSRIQQMQAMGPIPANFRKHLDILQTAAANSTHG